MTIGASMGQIGTSVKLTGHKNKPQRPEPPGPRTETGWVCPLCGRANAPWNPSCHCTREKANEPT